ncbi:hypothetical protein EZV62_024223 [Acer yangbiense]|uniref:Uncharacterized protein n=1 Tax=Acer yangbiense TaxID=1000413 RepID=A0A5C7H4N9_9ROSI|nr:hypothetical protein EZV62_024223 [Acer yangbiense]
MKRTFKKFSFRGVDLDALLDSLLMSLSISSLHVLALALDLRLSCQIKHSNLASFGIKTTTPVRGNGNGNNNKNNGLVLMIECSSRPQKKATAHHRKTRPRKSQPWDINCKPTVYAPLLPLPPDWTFLSDDDSSSSGDTANGGGVLAGIINEILSRNHIPVIVEGTNYYIQALVSPFLLDDSAEDTDESCPSDLLGDEQTDLEPDFGSDSAYSYENLKDLDPVAAKRIHPNNHRKISQYLSLYARSGVLPSKLYQGKAAEVGCLN